jgi:hypothetical protein
MRIEAVKRQYEERLMQLPSNVTASEDETKGSERRRVK